MRRLLFASALIFASAPAGAWEFIQGGYVCHPGLSHGSGPYNACTDVAWREANGRVVLDGWYKSAGALLLGSPKACVTARSEFLFHGTGAYRPGRSPWDGFIGNDSVSKRMMERSAWGRRIQRHLEATGALETPAFTTLTGAELIARFGVPACGSR